MSYSLKNRNVLVMGGSRGLGALIVQDFAREGSNVAINYASSKEAAEELAGEVRSQFSVKAITIQGDAGLVDDCKKAVKTTIEQLGGIDVVISNAGWTKITDFGDLDAMTDEEWDKCWAVNVKSNMYLFREALPTFNANPEGGALIITSSTAAISQVGSSMPYSVTKAAEKGLHLMKCLANTQGSKVRVNAVLPGLLLTEWGNRFPPEKIQAYKNLATLKKAPDLADTSNAFIMIAKNASMTGQSIQIDAGAFVR